MSASAICCSQGSSCPCAQHDTSPQDFLVYNFPHSHCCSTFTSLPGFIARYGPVHLSPMHYSAVLASATEPSDRIAAFRMTWQDYMKLFLLRPLSWCSKSRILLILILTPTRNETKVIFKFTDPTMKRFRQQQDWKQRAPCCHTESWEGCCFKTGWMKREVVKLSSHIEIEENLWNGLWEL